MRGVLDSNVVISATLIQGGNEDRILRAWRQGAFELVLSPHILDEMGRALFYERLRARRWMSETEVISLLQALAQEGVVVSGERHVRASRDPEDDKFLAAAVEGRAQYVVTGDRDLLELETYRGIEIVTPGAFLAILQRRKTGS